MVTHLRFCTSSLSPSGRSTPQPFPLFLSLSLLDQPFSLYLPGFFVNIKVMKTIALLLLFYCSFCANWSNLDNIIQQAISNRAFPGGVLSVGNITTTLYTKAYGTLTYQQDIYQEPVLSSTRYDIASVTKILGTTAAIMQLVESGNLKVSDLVSKFIPEYDSNQKRNTTIGNLLMHSAGLLYDYPGPLPSTPEQVWEYIYFCRPAYPIGSKFSYSNLGFALLAKITEVVTKRSFVDYYHQNEVLMSLKNTSFNPKSEEVYNIAPTEFDTQIRHRIVRGEPHERLTYFLNGAAGHSGYFSTAADLLQYTRILLNYGKVPGSPRVFSEQTVKTFTSRVSVDYPSSRGYGFDTHCPGSLMKNCFGHDGSTGCSAWGDRSRNISFSFVSNRGHPNVDNNLYWDYIPKIADEIVKALENNE